MTPASRRLKNHCLSMNPRTLCAFGLALLSGSLVPALDAQLLVFTGDSLQGRLSNEQAPRAIYFNDR